MSISHRYRALTGDLRDFFQQLPGETTPKACNCIKAALEKLAELEEDVGDISKMKLEHSLTPVLLKGHNKLDQGRLILLEAQEDALAGKVWDFQQAIYRLLNAL